MTVYRCYFRDTAGTQIGWKPLLSGSDSGARRSAMALLRDRKEISRMEVWRDSDLAFRLTRSELSRWTFDH